MHAPPTRNYCTVRFFGQIMYIFFYTLLHKLGMNELVEVFRFLQIYYILWSGKQEMREIRGARNGEKVKEMRAI